jgi:hypothetical protein
MGGIIYGRSNFMGGFLRTSKFTDPLDLPGVAWRQEISIYFFSL